MPSSSLEPRPGSPDAPMLALRLPSSTRYLHMVHELARKLAEASGFEAGAAEEIALAVDEATTNVIQHAYGGAPDRPIEIRFRAKGDRLDIEILHEGDPPGPLPLPEPDLKRLVAQRRRGGLGLRIMHEVMDRVDYDAPAAGRARCVMVRYKRRRTASS